jgi:hypothetical protein
MIAPTANPSSFDIREGVRHVASSISPFFTIGLQTSAGMD